MSNVMQAHRERLGKRIRAARITSGKSHDALAAEVGTSRQHLIKLEKGQHVPRDGMLERIAEATGKSLSFFDSEEDEEESDPMVHLMGAIRRLVRDEMSAATRKPDAQVARA